MNWRMIWTYAVNISKKLPWEKKTIVNCQQTHYSMRRSKKRRDVLDLKFMMVILCLNLFILQKKHKNSIRLEVNPEIQVSPAIVLLESTLLLPVCSQILNSSGRLNERTSLKMSNVDSLKYYEVAKDRRNYKWPLTCESVCW